MDEADSTGRAPSSPADLPAIPWWRPAKLPDDTWSARHDAPDVLPATLTGRRIIVTDRRRQGWTATVLEVIERTAEYVLVRNTPRYHRRPPPDKPPTAS
ncbi:MAG: hypothetical protein F4Z12_03215 [Acidobacteria bacterium]|nr:hypothetical protein [Acidobacteriota bacterium]MYE94524.1 hypothetical protein [Gemmatimonadota bacterium]MYJ12209.1 hypothetical protein [Gemmatimonadota bacterium]